MIEDQLVLEVSKPDRGSFISFDSEGQSKIVFIADASQKSLVEQLNLIPYGQTFKIAILKEKI